MKFKPLTKKYNYSSEPLHEGTPLYLVTPLEDWIASLLIGESLLTAKASYGEIFSPFIGQLNVLFRESFPSRYPSFNSFIFRESERVLNFLSFCLQNLASVQQANALEKILSDGGSAWRVVFTKKTVRSDDIGVAELSQRVPDIVQEASESALSTEDLLKEAWNACYSKNPDYAKTVSNCVDVLEGIYKDKYFPNDTKPVLARFIKSFNSGQTQLSYKGVTLVNPPSILTDIGSDFTQIRGQHTKGNGRIPTKEEAEFVLHYTIFVWNIYN